jgi:hypothetical protein
LVGLGVFNIMIIILIFKAAWYNEFLAEVVKAGRPNDYCPPGTNSGFVQAQYWLDNQRQVDIDALYSAYVVKFAS